MNDKTEEEEVKGEFYDYSNDFHLLSRKERRGLVKNAKHLLKLQRENAMLADADSAPAPPNETAGLG
ncbi:MAG: hypothetical protein LBD96_01460 [Treponema sp.]|jgi:hypothetical protein|nr:hypothetical protein [Treponema sp.]